MSQHARPANQEPRPPSSDTVGAIEAIVGEPDAMSDLKGTAQHLTAEREIDRMNRDLLLHARGAMVIDLMESIKARCDPNGILNLGKL